MIETSLLMSCIGNKQLFPNINPTISSIRGYWNMPLVCCLGWPHWWLPLLWFVPWRDVTLTQRPKAENTVETVDGCLGPELRDTRCYGAGSVGRCTMRVIFALHLISSGCFYTKWLLQYRIILYRFSDCNGLYCWNDGLCFFLHRVGYCSLLQPLPERCSLHPNPLTLWTSSSPSS